MACLWGGDDKMRIMLCGACGEYHTFGQPCTHFPEGRAEGQKDGQGG
jgi:hypothetical protein